MPNSNNPLLGHNGKCFVWRGSFETKDTVKAAGFRWDPANKQWWTDDVGKAKTLKAYASERAIEIIEAAAFNAEISAATCIEDLPPSIIDMELAQYVRNYANAEGEQLLPYQQAGIVAGFHYLNHGKGVYLGDEMGLGKTVQALIMSHYNNIHTRRTIVICPKAVTVSWQREIQKWLGAESRIYPSKAKDSQDAKFVIVPWSQVGKFLKALDGKGTVGAHLIVDECHFGKNPTAARTKAVYGYWKKTGGSFKQFPGIMDYVESKPICLTGTPMPNRYIEAQTALKATGAGFAQKRDDYGKRYCYNRNQFTPRGFDFTGSINGDELYVEMRASTLIRRLVTEVLSDIPPVRQQPIFLSPTSRELKKLIAVQDAEYPPEAREELLERVKGGSPVDFDVMSLVRHEMGQLKTDAVVEHILTTIENIPDGEGVVVFAHHKDVIEDICAMLIAQGTTADYAHGEHDAQERQLKVDKFAAGQFKVFVASISACGTGLNGMQTRSSTCMFAEFPWTPGEIAQAIGRLKRIGQTNSVLAQFLVIEGSLDAYIIETVLQKVITQYIALDQAQEAT